MSRFPHLFSARTLWIKARRLPSSRGSSRIADSVAKGFVSHVRDATRARSSAMPRRLHARHALGPVPNVCTKATGPGFGTEGRGAEARKEVRSSAMRCLFSDTVTGMPPSCSSACKNWRRSFGKSAVLPPNRRTTRRQHHQRMVFRQHRDLLVLLHLHSRLITQRRPQLFTLVETKEGRLCSAMAGHQSTRSHAISRIRSVWSRYPPALIQDMLGLRAATSSRSYSARQVSAAKVLCLAPKTRLLPHGSSTNVMSR